MGSSSNHVKQLLATARVHHRPELLQEVVEELLATEAKSSTTSTELRVLSAEVAVELQQWPVAGQLLRGVGASHETRLLRIRKIFCDVLVSLHDVDAQSSLGEEEKVQEKLMGAATVLQTLADSVEMWPESVDAVLIGIRTLWTIISPLLDAGRQAEVCDAVVFLATLHQQLHIGGGYTLVQWMARSALCLFAADRVGEAFAHFTIAMDAAALLSNQRLYVQLLRMSANAVSAKEKAAATAKGKTEFLGSYRARPVVYAVLLTQLVLTGQVEVEACREELHSTYEALHSGNSEVVLPTEAAAAAAGKGKKKVPAAKQQQQQQQAPAARVTEAFAITDLDVLEEVKSDLLLCLALHDTLTAQQQEELERKRGSPNRRVRSFIAYAAVVQEARRRGLAQLCTCADAAVLTTAHRADYKATAQQLLSVLKGTNAIHDESERQYTLRVGVSLLWNYLLPFLQPAFAGDVQPALDAILEVSQTAIPLLRHLFLQVGLQQCHIAYNEDHRATLHHLLPVLKEEYARGCGGAGGGNNGSSSSRSGTPPIEFALQWMQYQLTVLDEPESSLTNEQDRCLFAIEQARTVSNPCKRIPLLKAAFQHLPPLLRAEGRPEPAASEGQAKQGGHAPPAQQQPKDQQAGSPSGTNGATLPVQQRRSTVQLYKELLDLCMEEVSPSLLTVAGAVAEALRSLPRPPSGTAVDDLEEIQAIATLHSATLQWRQLEDEASAAADTMNASTVRPQSRSGRDGMEAQLVTLLKEAAQRGAGLEARSPGSGAWLVANACITFLAMKQQAYDAGDYAGHMAELLELHSTYAALFAKGRVQDVALLSDLTVAAVVGLLAGFVTSKAAAVVGSPNTPASAVRQEGSISALPDATYAGLIRRIYGCTAAEPSNAQLRKAESLSREALLLIPTPKHKWFLAMLYPTVLRLLNEKPVVFLHPQEQLLLNLGLLTAPSLSSTDRLSLLEQEMRGLVRKDPSVRLCAWVAAIAAEMHREDVVLECCQLADGLYASGRLGWDSVCDVHRSTVYGGSTTAAMNNNNSNLATGNIVGGGGGFGAIFNSATNNANSNSNANANKKGSVSLVLVQREAGPPVKPDADDWGAYAQLLLMKTLVCANHLQGLSGDVRRLALQQLFTSCVNSIIAAIRGPAAGKVLHFSRAFSAYYAILRENNNSNLPLSHATFILPSLRMLLSKPILTHIPKREWSATFTELVYQLGALLIYISYSSGRGDDVQQLGTHLRLLRELLPPRFQKSLKVRETTEVCYQNPTVDGFLHLSRNMEAELQTHGWLIVAQRAGDEGSAAEAFALALSGTQANAFARAQCLFEFAYSSLQQGSGAPLVHAADQLREALRTLEGLPETVPLLYDSCNGTAAPQQAVHATLVDRSLTAAFLKTSRTRSLESGGGSTGLASGAVKQNAEKAKKQTAARAAAAAPARTLAKSKTASQGNNGRSGVAAPPSSTSTVNFQHVFLGMRIVAVLFRIASPATTATVAATGAGAAAVKLNKSAAMASRRDCANVLLDYISCLWELCGKLLRGSEDATRTHATPRASATSEGIMSSSTTAAHAAFVLPDSSAEYYGFAEPAGAARRVRRLVPDEELQLNTPGMWQTLLQLGEYLLDAGDEAHAFMVYTWLRFAAVIALGDPASSAPCALVQRVCNLQMCHAAVRSGLSDAPYVAALRRLEDAHLPLDSGVLQPAEKSAADAAETPAVESWLIGFVLAECEARLAFGQVEQAAKLASEYLLCGRQHDEVGVSSTDAVLNGTRILAMHDVVRARYGDALRVVDAALQSMRSHRSAFEVSGPFAVSTWIRLCEVKVRALLAQRATDEAVRCVGAVRAQLVSWRAAAMAGPKSSQTLRSLSLRGELSDAIQYWARQLLALASSLHPSSTALQLFPGVEGPLHEAAVKLFHEVVALTESCDSVYCQMYGVTARFRLRDRVTPAWVAQHASSAKEHLCPRLTTLLAEMRSLQHIAETLGYVLSEEEVKGTAFKGNQADQAAALGPTVSAASRNVSTASSLSTWKAFLLYWSAVDRLEAHRIVECLLGSFRRLSMADLQLPTTDAPAHLENEVLKFIRGVADNEAAAASDDDNTTTARQGSSNNHNNGNKVGARWRHTPRSAMTEIEQALQHYGVPTQEATAIMDLSLVRPFLQTSLELVRPWCFSRLAKTVLIALAETEVHRVVENQIAAGDDMVGEKLDRQREVVLTAAWNRTPLVPPKTDKTTSRARKSLTSGKQRSSNDASMTFSAPMLSPEEQDLLRDIKEGAEEAVQYLHIDLAEQLYDHLSNLAVLFGRPRLAAAAAEQLQACQLIGYLCGKAAQEMADAVEGRLWRQFAFVHPLLRNATACRTLLDDLLALSPMGKYIRSCAALCVEERKDEEVPVPPSSHARDAVAAEVSPYVIDAPVLTIALSPAHAGYGLVLLRHPDGAVEGRRRSLTEAECSALAQQCEAVQAQTSELLGGAKAGRLGSAAQRVTTDDAATLVDPFTPVTSRLLLDFQPSLQSFGAKSPLYLCLAPRLQSFAWEQTSVLASCSAVVRELSAAVVVSKFNEPSRTLRRPSTHGSKPTGPASPKGAPVGPSVCIVDAFGDHASSVESVFNTESAKAKTTQQVIVTCSAPGTPPDPAYLAWTLNASATSALVVDMCGSFIDALPLSQLAVLRLSQVGVAVMADGAVNAESRQREERQQLGGLSSATFVPPRWMVQLLLLLRGVRFIVANTFPCSPEASDGLARRCLSSLFSAKTLVEQLRGKARDSKTPLVTFFGAFGNSNTGKQKA